MKKIVVGILAHVDAGKTTLSEGLLFSSGMIGKLVINMLKSYKLKTIVFDPFLPDEKAEELGVEKCSLDELFRRAFDVHCTVADFRGGKFQTTVKHDRTPYGL